MSYDRSPGLPRKPEEYRQMKSSGSINDLLKSLDIDAEYSNSPSQIDHGVVYHQDPSFAEQTNHHQHFANASVPQHSRLYNYQQREVGVNAGTDMSEPMFQATHQERQHYSQNLLSGHDRPDAARSANEYRDEESVPPVSNVISRPTRKPVDVSAQPRTYYSPDDLDELVKDHPRNRRATHTQALHNNSGIINTSNGNPPMSMPATRHDLSMNHASIEQSGRHDVLGFMSDTGLPTNSHMRDVMTSGYPIDIYGAPNLNSPMPLDDANRFRRRSNSPLQQLRSNSSVPRIPSPPMRHDSLPYSEENHQPPRHLAAFRASADLAPPFHARNSSQQARAIPRQDSMPIRSMSSLSNYSRTSNESSMPQRYIPGSIDHYDISRAASPDKYYHPDAAALAEDDRSVTASVPPIAQSRRGRQKGEIVAESDLPAMPALFTESSRRQNYSRSPVDTVPVSISPSRSPTRNSTILPNRSPRKRQSFVRGPDKLQSIKTLPVKPIRCPPLCLEERYHPFAFVKTNKFKIKVFPYQEPFVAGGEIFGHIDIISDEGFRAQLGSTQVLVGEIGVEVIGYEEMHHTESGHNPRSFTFLYSRRVFQTIAETHPSRALEEHLLTSAVLSSPPPDQDGYRAASKGTTSFPFSFRLPVDAPSSADVQTARLKYLLTGYATVKLQGSHEVIATSVPIRVVEAWDVNNPVYTQPIEAAQGRDIANYHEIAATAKLPRSLYMEGETISGIIRIANHSSKKIRDVKFLLMNKITFFGDKRSPVHDLNPSEDFAIEAAVHSHSEAHVLVNGEQETWNFNIPIPVERCLSVRNTALFEVTPFVLIKISTGPLQKSVRLEVPPISIASTNSMIDNERNAAPVSDIMKWSNLPFLYRQQLVVDGHPGPVEKGTFEVFDLITYFSARERVLLLNTD